MERNIKYMKTLYWVL